MRTTLLLAVLLHALVCASAHLQIDAPPETLWSVHCSDGSTSSSDKVPTVIDAPAGVRCEVTLKLNVSVAAASTKLIVGLSSVDAPAAPAGSMSSSRVG